LLNNADKAMYMAKNSGRNHVMAFCPKTMLGTISAQALAEPNLSQPA
jgi:predicted signal transduction protein with EAL and GGDEF domain